MFHVELSPRARRDLKKIDSRYKTKILLAFVKLRINPYFGKKLNGEYQGCFCIRVWPYRVIYNVQNESLLILVIRIGHRQGVYK